MVDTMREVVEDLAERVDRHLEKPTLDEAVKTSVLREIRDIGGPNQTLESVLLDDAREEFIVDYLARERARFRADTVADLPSWVAADSVRSEPLCSCRVDCPVKNAQLPRTVKDARDIRRGCRRYKQSHQGHPEALTAANQAFDQFVADAHDTLRIAITALSSETPVEELDIEDDGSATDASPTDDSSGEAPADD